MRPLNILKFVGEGEGGERVNNNCIPLAKKVKNKGRHGTDPWPTKSLIIPFAS